MYICILQPWKVIFTNHTKRNNNKSRIVPIKDRLYSQSLLRRGPQSHRELHKYEQVPQCNLTALGGFETEGVLRAQPTLLHSVLVKPAEALGKVPAQGDRENVEEDEQSEGVE